MKNTAGKYTDLTYLKEKAHGKKEILLEMIDIFIEQTGELINRMREGFATKDYVVIKAAAHKLMPSFYIVGMSNDCRVKARMIQEFAEAHNDSSLSPLLDELINACEHAVEELKTDKQQLKKKVK